MPTPNPFPLEIVEKVNSPELLAFLQQFGHDKYADAEDVNTIVQALQFIYENLGGTAISDLTKFTARPTITIDGLSVAISDDGTWLINGVPYAQTTGASFTVNLASEGNVRLDIIVADDTGDYRRLQGSESETNPAAPTLPLNCLLVSIVSVGDSGFDIIPLSAIQDLIDPEGDNQLIIGPNGKLYINTAGGSVPDATESVKGKIQIATEAQRVAGSNDTTAITPLKLKATADEVTEEAANYSDNLVNNLLDGVSTPGNTLLKLYNLILGVSAEDYVANIAARNAYNVPHLPFSLFVTDDGDGKWAKYQATTTGVGATFVKISDPDLLNAVMSAAAIKAAYESNSDTNAFTNALLSKLNGIASGATANSSDATLLNRSNHTGTQLASTISDFTSAVNALLTGLVVNTRTVNSKPLSSDVVLTAADIGYSQVVISSNTTAQASWNGKVVKVRGNLTITIPASGLPTGYTFEFIVDPTYTLTWAIVTKTWVLGTPSANGAKSIGTILQDEQDDTKIYLLT